VLASKKHEVIGVDIDPEPVRLINQGLAPVHEPELQTLISAARDSLSATTDLEDAILRTDITFVIVPTPSTPSGTFSNELLLTAVTRIGSAVRRKDTYHLVVITSTVMPGSTGGEICDALERFAGRRVGHDLGLCYNPEFVALGSVIGDMLSPDIVLIGESDPRAGELLATIYRQVCDNDPPIERMNFINAELTKIAVNTYVTTKISYANMLGDICDRLAGADVDAVTAALGRDSRIGPKYLKAAVGYGGPCFPRDNAAFSALARNIGARPDIAEATDRLNRYQIDRLMAVVRRWLPNGGAVGILGLAYKPHTGVTEEAQGVVLAEELANEGYCVIAYDPLAVDNAAKLLGDKVTVARSAEECARAVDLLVIATAWPEFAELPVGALARSVGRISVIDCWRQLHADRYCDIADIVHLGRGGDITFTAKTDRAGAATDARNGHTWTRAVINSHDPARVDRDGLDSPQDDAASTPAWQAQEQRISTR